MTFASVLGAIVVGLVLGVLGRMVAPGRQGIPIWMTIVVGIAAAFVGTAIARGLGYADTPGFDWLELITQIVVAAVGVSLASRLYNPRSLNR
jgi:uncharacterized membrane protein YeaQ/YmgE (transglycosylase-associated protein family)